MEEWTSYTGAGSFYGRSDVVRVKVAQNVDEIECGGVFFGCENLREVDLGNVTKIGAFAFFACSSLAHVFLPPHVTEISAMAFDDCSGLVRVELCEGLQIIGNAAFEYCWSLEQINFPRTLTEIGDEAFVLCKALKQVALPEGLRKVKRSAFVNCTSLEVLTVRSNFTDIGKSAFFGCGSLRAIQFCEGIHHIASDSFENCTSLRSVSVPPSSFLIEWGNAPNCRLLRSSTIPPYVDGHDRTVVSGKLGGMSLQLLSEAEERINGLIGQQDQTMEEKLDQLRGSIAHFKMLDATTCLELAIRKADIEAQNVESIVMNGVLPFLKIGNKWDFL
ncbi:hypothetical protein ACHAWF_014716 [Thalassiosira exigua]